MKGIAWPNNLTSKEESHTYTLQVAGVKKTALKRIEKEFKGWKKIGEGLDVKSDEFIILWTKSFENRSSFVTFAKNLKFEIVELTNKGKKVSIGNGRK